MKSRSRSTRRRGGGRLGGLGSSSEIHAEAAQGRGVSSQDGEEAEALTRDISA